MVGALINYPFDSYHLLLGLGVGYLGKNGADDPIPRRADASSVALSLGEEIPRITIDAPVALSPEQYSPDFAYVDSTTYFRPLYLKLVTLLLVLSISFAATWALVLRPFDQIIPTIGVVVLGVWGARTLLVGSYPPDTTAVDLVLTLVIVLLLLQVMARGLLYMGRRAFSKPGGPDDASPQ